MFANFDGPRGRRPSGVIAPCRSVRVRSLAEASQRAGNLARVVDEIARCPHCGSQLEFKRFNGRFGNQGFMYCDRDATVVTWSSYDPTYSSLSHNAHPWMLDAEAKRRVEDAMTLCPQGGRFRFSAQPRCPHCLEELPELGADRAFFVVLGERVDGETTSIWATGE
jgi:uncharacterized protein with PIN domain